MGGRGILCFLELKTEYLARLLEAPPIPPSPHPPSKEGGENEGLPPPLHPLKGRRGVMGDGGTESIPPAPCASPFSAELGLG